MFSGDYIWKYTHNGYDFGDVGATPIYFPIEWHNSKIPGYALRVSVPNRHGFKAHVVMSHVAARFFLPQVAGLPIIPPRRVCFASTMMKTLTRQRTWSINPGSAGPGLVLIGAATVDWWPEQPLATTRYLPPAPDFNHDQRSAGDQHAEHDHHRTLDR